MRLLDVAARRGGERVVLYMDVDVIVGAPLAPLLSHATRVLGETPATILTFQEAAVTRDDRMYFLDPSRLTKEPYHGGIFSVQAGKSEGCLGAWGTKVLGAIASWMDLDDPHLVKRSHVRDQPLLKEIIDEGSCSFAPLPDEYLSKPTPESIDARHYAVLNHLSRTSRLKGKRNRHNITRPQLGKLGADLLGVHRSERATNWWQKETCDKTADISPDDSEVAAPLILDCDLKPARPSPATATRRRRLG